MYEQNGVRPHGYEKPNSESEISGSIYCQVERELFDRQVLGSEWFAAQLDGQLAGIDQDELYKRFQSLSAEAIVPEQDDLEALFELVEAQDRVAERLEQEWSQGGFDRWVTDTDENGNQVWVFNSAVRVVRSKVDLQLRRVRFGYHEFKIWHVGYDIVPVKDEQGAYVPFEPGAHVDSLLAFNTHGMGLGDLDERYLRAREESRSYRILADDILN